MTVYHVDYNLGIEGNNGLSWRTPWKRVYLGPGYNGAYANEYIKVAKTPDPVLLGTGIFWYGSGFMQMIEPPTANTIVLDYGCYSGLWIPKNNFYVDAQVTNTYYKAYSRCDSFIQTLGITRSGLGAYFVFSPPLNLSGYDTISLWYSNSVTVNPRTVYLRVGLDTSGLIYTDEFDLMGSGAGAVSYYSATTYRPGGFGTGINSLSLWVRTSGAATYTMRLNSILACKTSGMLEYNDQNRYCLHQGSLISTSCRAIPQVGDIWMTIANISGSYVYFDSCTASMVNTQGNGYPGPNYSGLIYKREAVPHGRMNLTAGALLPLSFNSPDTTVAADVLTGMPRVYGGYNPVTDQQDGITLIDDRNYASALISQPTSVASCYWSNLGVVRGYSACGYTNPYNIFHENIYAYSCRQHSNLGNGTALMKNCHLGQGWVGLFSVSAYAMPCQNLFVYNTRYGIYEDLLDQYVKDLTVLTPYYLTEGRWTDSTVGSTHTLQSNYRIKNLMISGIAIAPQYNSVELDIDNLYTTDSLDKICPTGQTANWGKRLMVNNYNGQPLYRNAIGWCVRATGISRIADLDPDNEGWVVETPCASIQEPYYQSIGQVLCRSGVVTTVKIWIKDLSEFAGGMICARKFKNPDLILPPQTAPYLNGFAFREEIDIYNDQMNFRDFPFYLRIVSTGLGQQCPSGYCVRFTKDDGITELPYNRHFYQNSGGIATGMFYIKMDIPVGETSIWMYYGNPSATDSSSLTGIFDADYVGVYHMNEFGAEGTGIYDLSIYGNHGIKMSPQGSLPTGILTEYGYSMKFDGMATGVMFHYINCGTGYLKADPWFGQFGTMEVISSVYNPIMYNHSYSMISLGITYGDAFDGPIGSLYYTSDYENPTTSQTNKLYEFFKCGLPYSNVTLLYSIWSSNLYNSRGFDFNYYAGSWENINKGVFLWSNITNTMQSGFNILSFTSGYLGDICIGGGVHARFNYNWTPYSPSGSWNGNISVARLSKINRSKEWQKYTSLNFFNTPTYPTYIYNDKAIYNSDTNLETNTWTQRSVKLLTTADVYVDIELFSICSGKWYFDDFTVE